MRLIDADALEKTICELIEQHAVQNLDANVPTVNPPSNKWISIDECMPEPMKDVLVIFESGIMCVGFMYYDYRLLNRWSIHIDHALYQPCPINPKYWMPLPEPPKGGLKYALD